MPTKISQEVTTKILEDLTDARDVDDIVMEVCEKTGLDWELVEAYVNRLSAENKNKITLAQSPLLTLLALGTFLLGAGVILYGFYQAYLIYLANSQAFGLYLLTSGGGLFWNFVLGTAMITGSLAGMQDVWEAIFEKLKIGA